MPKSRFNAVREKARASRHNPIGGKQAPAGGTRGSSSSDNGASSSITLQPVTAAGKGDVLPVLKSLPLPNDSGAASASTDRDALWALTSLTALLAVKDTRNEVLQPKHDVVPRILHQLNAGRAIQVRDAASGCLRNICIEAAAKAKKLLERDDSMQTILQELSAVASDLGLIEACTERHASAPSLPVDKPVSEMNRKERRKLAKLEAKRGGGKPDPQANANGHANGGADMEQDVPASEPNDDLDTKAIHFSHFANLSAVLWCLAEMSPQAVEACQRSAPLLCRIWSQSINAAMPALRDASNSATPAQTGTKINVDAREQRDVAQACIDAALTSANALVTLSDANPAVCAALAGFSRQDLVSARKAKGKVNVVLTEGVEYEAARSHGKENMQTLLNAMMRLDEEAGIGRKATSLALLAAAVIRNVQSSLPKRLPASLSLTVSDREAESLSVLEKRYSSSLLCRYIRSATDSANLDDVHNVNLALEIVAELAGWQGQSGDEDSKQQRGRPSPALEADDAHADNESDVLMDDESPVISELDDMEEGEGEEANARTLHDAPLEPLSDVRQIVEALQPLVFNFDLAAPMFEAEDVNGADRRGAVVRALSALGNLLLRVASFATPPPSQPSVSASQRMAAQSLHRWSQDPVERRVMTETWMRSFELASRAAASPLLSQDEAAGADGAAQHECRRIVESCMGIMWSIARCFEGLDASDVLCIDATAFAGQPQCVLAQQGSGVVESLIAAYKASKQTSGEAKGIEGEEAAVVVSQDPTTWATADGVRVHALGVLSTLARQSHVWPNHLAAIAALQCSVLEAVPSRSGQGGGGGGGVAKLVELGLSDWTSMDGMIIAANGIIDTFADEQKPWDGAYAQVGVHERIKRQVPAVRAASRTIDKRTQPTLRAAAEEVAQNLHEFVRYRESLR